MEDADLREEALQREEARAGRAVDNANVDQSLTVWGDMFSAQCREGETLELHLRDPQITVRLPKDDADLLTALLGFRMLRRTKGTLP